MEVGGLNNPVCFAEDSRCLDTAAFRSPEGRSFAAELGLVKSNTNYGLNETESFQERKQRSTESYSCFVLLAEH